MRQDRKNEKSKEKTERRQNMKTKKERTMIICLNLMISTTLKIH